jgi:lipid A 4'-phosphatase
MSDMTARKSRRFFLSFDFLIPVFLFIVSVIVFRDSRLDLTIQQAFYHPSAGWFLKNNPLFLFVYHYGNIPALLTATAGLVLFGLSWQAYKWARWRKIGLFLVLVMLIGPGLIVNVALKDHWGRPRPRNVTDFDGRYQYEKLMSVDTSSPGLSFPCGHASMGFYLFIPWFVLRKKRRGWAYVSLAAGILFGLLIGLARIAQGGHWFSDVVSAGLLVYLTGTVCFHALQLNQALWFYPKHLEIDRKQRTIVGLIVSIMLVFLILGVVLATPYNKAKTFVSERYRHALPVRLKLSLDLNQADLNITPADSIRIASEVQGFGFPGSKLTPVYHETSAPDSLIISYKQKQKGWFTELDNRVSAVYPFARGGNFNLKQRSGTANIILPDSLAKLNLTIRIDNGTLDLDLPSACKPRISLKGDHKLTDKTGFTNGDSVYINEDFRVSIIVVKGEVILH